MKNIFIRACGFILLAMSFAGCVYHKQEEIVPAAICLTKNSLSDSVSFKKDILPLFNSNCSTQGCHTSNSPKGNLNLDPLTAYQQLSKKGSGYIDTVQPAFSILMSVLVSINKPMPPKGPLAPCDIEIIRKWMEQKAHDN